MPSLIRVRSRRGIIRPRRVKHFILAAAALSLIIVSMHSPVPVSALSTVLRVVPSTQSVTQGTLAGIDVRIEDVTNLYGAEVHLSFDPTLLSAQDADLTQPGIQIELGPLLTSGGSGTYAVGVNSANNAAGTIDIAIALVAVSPISGSGVFAHINFVGLAAGSSSVHIASAILADRDANKLAFTMQDASITVLRRSISAQAGTTGESAAEPAEVPEADTLLLFGAGGTGLVSYLLLQWRRRCPK